MATALAAWPKIVLFRVHDFDLSKVLVVLSKESIFDFSVSTFDKKGMDLDLASKDTCLERQHTCRL